MNTKAIPYQPQGSERVEPTPIDIVIHARARNDWSPSALSVPLVRIAADILLLVAGTIVGGTIGHLFQRTHTFELSTQSLLIGSLMYTGLVLCLLQSDNAYPRVCSLLHVKETETVLRVSIKAVMVTLVLCIVARYPVPRMAMLGAWICGTALLAIGRVWVLEAVRQRIAPALSQRRSLIYGSRRTARRFFTGALHSPMLGIEPVGFVASESEHSDAIYSYDYFQRDSRPIFHEALSVEMLTRLKIKDVFVCDSSISDHALKTLREVAQSANCTLSLVDDQEILANKCPTRVWEMDGLFIATTEPNDPGNFYKITKRLIDIACSSILILLSAPIWALLAIAIRCESKGPVFFRQTRVGQDGRSFEILKFRTMKVDAPKYARSPNEHTDSRITRVGRFLRKTSLDEIPQLINVLNGDMTLVGPRPEMPFITEEYGPWEATRLTVPQGITGLWQLSADRQYAIHQSIEYDLYYIQNRTVLMDVAILLHTLVYAAKGI
ncbi:MAG: exopolysaccharide biosynthesis polyprenyl glycosylphosphotransferase [Terracidiphilus sp.]